MDANQLLIDAAGRPLETANHLAPQLSPELLNEHPGGHDNSIAWLLWHTGREIDVQVAHLSGWQQVWEVADYRKRLDLPELGDSLGYGHTPEQARRIVITDLDALLSYLEAATEALINYIGTLGPQELDEVIDTNWNPPVTRGARLVSIVDDASQHVGQASYALGILQTGT